MSTGGMYPDPAHALTPSGNLRRRQWITRIVESGAISGAVLAVAVLLVLVGFTAIQGIGSLSLSFFTSELPPPTGDPGGMGPALVGTIEIVLIAALIAIPVGVLTALYLSEFASAKTEGAVRMGLDLMAGLPTIIAGIFIFRLIVYNNGPSGMAGSLALSIVMTPLVARASLEALRRVPGTWREASDALGVSRWRAITGVIVPGAISGITTAAILAVARGAGETAPLLFTTGSASQGYQLNPMKPMASIPVEILNLLETGYPAAKEKAWGAAFSLMLVILIVNIGARVTLRRGERKRGL